MSRKGWYHQGVANVRVLHSPVMKWARNDFRFTSDNGHQTGDVGFRRFHDRS
jgi:hypothetical protein